MSSHGAVLLLFATNANCTWREAALRLGLTERHVARLVRDLAEAGLLLTRREGRRNVYTVDTEAARQHGWLVHVDLGKVAGSVE